MKKFVGKRLPEISPATSKFLLGSLDFLGINHYTTLYARNDRAQIRKLILKDAIADAAVITTRKMSSHNLLHLTFVSLCVYITILTNNLHMSSIVAYRGGVAIGERVCTYESLSLGF